MDDTAKNICFSNKSPVIIKKKNVLCCLNSRSQKQFLFPCSILLSKSPSLSLKTLEMSLQSTPIGKGVEFGGIPF